MMKESIKNVDFLCHKCSEEKRTKGQKKLKKLGLKVGDYVKSTVVDGKQQEHMWFLVMKIYERQKEFMCRLDNEPFFVKNIEYNQIVKLKFDDIMDIKRV